MIAVYVEERQINKKGVAQRSKCDAMRSEA
jgi:hypothetical protein